MYESWYNVLILVCLLASIGMFIWVGYAVKAEILKKSDEKSEQRRCELRRHNEIYRYDYWKARNRANLWEDVENSEVLHNGK